MGNFIHPRFIKQTNLPTKPQHKKLGLQMVTGKTFFIVREQATVTLITQHGHEEQITLDVAPVRKHNLILGLPWCTLQEIQFNWKNHDIQQWSPNCKTNCFPTHTVAPLYVQPLQPEAHIPTRGTPESIGYDLYSTETIVIPPSERRTIGTGIAIQVPVGTYGRIAPRSGLAVKHNIDIAAGVIDPDYRGEIKAVLINNGQHPYYVTAGERVAQLILENAATEDIIVTELLNNTIRMHQGFGSTGMSDELVEIYEISLGHNASTQLRPQEERYAELRKLVPEYYHDFLDVFDGELSMSKCPERRPGYDFEINLKDNAKLPPPSKPYHMSQAETKILKECLDGMVATAMVLKCHANTPSTD